MSDSKSTDKTLNLYLTEAHPCSYLENKTAKTLFVDPFVPMDTKLYAALSQQGFRRSGNYLYRPHCDACSACIPTRVRTRDFVLSRNQKRVLKANQDLELIIKAPTYSDAHYALYASYIKARHPDGDMYPPSKDQFKNFLLCTWSKSLFYDFYLDEELIACALVDTLPDGLSAIYSFFNPNMPKRSLGTYCVLREIMAVKIKNLDYLYLGYWIKNCPKMSYKTNFKPIEVYQNNSWLIL